MIYINLLKKIATKFKIIHTFDFFHVINFINMKDVIYNYIKQHPLRFSLLLGLIIRIIAVIFSKGYGMHDDHFLVIEPPQSWVEGLDYNNWLPHNAEEPSGHSWFYFLLNYIQLLFFNFIGIINPQTKMLVMRFILAIYSLSIIVYTFKISYKISDINIASKITIITATIWFLPFLSVRNLVEIIAIPPLMYSLWILIKNGNQTNIKYFVIILAGFIGGIAFSIRYQTILFLGGIGLVILFKKEYKKLIYWTIGLVLSIFALQGIIDYCIWGKPFVEIQQYVIYNLENAYNYETNVWYSYLLLLAGIFIPPFGLIIMFFFFKNYKKYLIIFVPTILFIAFHSYFPNKQERFILTIVPFYSIIGLDGFFSYVKEYGYNKFLKYSFVFFLIISVILLPIITTTYSKKAMVESMYFFYPKTENIQAIVIENSNKENSPLMPTFYSGKRFFTINFNSTTQNEEFANLLSTSKIKPSYIIFIQEDNIQKRKNNIQKIFPNIQLEKIIKPSFIDYILHKLNPKNNNQTIHIYKICN